MTLTILHAPTHVVRSPRVIRRATRTAADSIGFTEAYNAIGLLAARRRYRLTVGSGGRDERRGAKDTPVLTRKAHVSLGAGAMQVSEEVEPSKFGPDRWLTFSLFEHDDVGSVAHVHMHPNATVRNRRASAPIVREYRESMATLFTFVRFLRNEGYLVVVTGDLNYPNVKRGPEWTPHHTFARLGLDVWSVGVDYVAHDPRLALVRKQVIRGGTDSDHPWLLATFRRAT